MRRLGATHPTLGSAWIGREKAVSASTPAEHKRGNDVSEKRIFTFSDGLLPLGRVCGASHARGFGVAGIPRGRLKNVVCDFQTAFCLGSKERVRRLGATHPTLGSVWAGWEQAV